jgi:hypothetical protein
MRWHTDRPVPALRPLRAVRAIVPVDIDRIDSAGRAAYAKARAYFRKKIRAHLRQRQAQETEPND